MLRRILTGLLCPALAVATAAAAPRPRNVILMIADGGGYNAWLAAAMYEGTIGRQFHDAEGWVALAATTYPLLLDPEPATAPPVYPSLVYDPARAWDGTPVPAAAPDLEQYPYFFEGYRWLRETAPDSASTATALATGVKSYNGAINDDVDKRPIEETIASIAERAGRAVGVVTSVPFNHATPAAIGGAHAKSRKAYCPIAIEMLTGPLDVIAGAGNPDFDNNGKPIGDGRRDYRYVGGENVWRFLEGKARLEPGAEVCTDDPDETSRLAPEQVRALAGWTLVQRRDEIERLRTGATPRKTLIVPQVGQAAFATGELSPEPHRVGGTLQQQRGSRADPRFTAPGDDPPIDTVPPLATLALAALNALDDDPDGLFLHVEGGAVDWAMHENQMGRVIEEVIDFEEAIDAVAAWVERNGGWDETLVIVTADHDLMLWGPHADRVPFDPLWSNGAGELPSYRWLSDHHSNALVPLWARGPGARSLRECVRGEDPRRGAFVDQTDVFEVVRRALGR